MSFITLADMAGYDVEVSELDVEFANTYTKQFLYIYNISPENLTPEGLAWAKEYAKIVALRRAYIRLAQSEDSRFFEKAQQMLQLQNELEKQFSTKFAVEPPEPNVYKVTRA